MADGEDDWEAAEDKKTQMQEADDDEDDWEAAADKDEEDWENSVADFKTLAVCILSCV
jgi:hypothetical protein